MNAHSDIHARKKFALAPSSGTETPNSLRSRAKARLVELLGEGEIGGLVDGGRSIYFDTTPLLNEQGKPNFKGVTWDIRTGLPDQPYVNGSPYVETPYAVEAQVKNDGSMIQRTVMERNADAVRFVVRIPALAYQDPDSGQIKPTSVAYAIDVRNYGGAWEERELIQIFNEKTTSPYQRATRVSLDPNGYPWDIRVRRVSKDSRKTELQNETWWESYTVLVEGKFTYPNTAFIYMEADAKQFGQSNIPERRFDVYGLKIQVPTNYDPVTRAYTGIWDGTFKKAVSDNPAWVLYDLLTQDRYGLGQYIDASTIDKFGAYQIARYCDELVPDGFGGMEPRYTYNGAIRNRQEAMKVVQSITTAFRGMAFWSLGQVFYSADMPSDPVKLVTPADVIGGRFNYSGTALKARHSVAMITWNDPSDLCRPAVEVVVNEDLIRKFGWNETSAQYPGCNSRGLAHRYGRWMLYTEENETDTVEYETSWDHANIQPGNLIAIADPAKAQVRNGGRLAETSTTWQTLDQPFPRQVGTTYYLMVEMPDGKIETRQIAEFSTDNSRVRVFPALSATPVLGAMWVIAGDVQPRLFRVLAVTETDKHIFKIQALLHDPTKFARIEQGLKLDPVNYTRPRTSINPPTNLNAVESLYFQNGVAKARLSVSWTPSNDFMASGYRVSADTPNGFVSYGEVAGTSIDIDDATPGAWVIYVQAVAITGPNSAEESLEFTVKGWESVNAPYVSHLEIVGRGSETTFGGSDCALTWRNNFPGSTYELGSEPNGAGTGNTNPFFRDNLIRIVDVDSEQVLRTEKLTTTEYTYRFDQNYEDSARLGLTPRRKFRVEVTVRDTIGRESVAAKLVVENPVPDLIIPTVTAGVESVFVSYVVPEDLDFAGALIWISQDASFNPLTTTPAYDGLNNLVSLPAEKFQTYYVRIGAYDSFGRTGINISPPIEVTANGYEVDQTPPDPPGALTLSSDVVRADDGTIRVNLVAEWGASASENLAAYEVDIQLDGGNWISFTTATPRYEWPSVQSNSTYHIRVRAVSRLGSPSIYTPIGSILTAANTTEPGAPSGLTASASLRSVYLRWVNPSDPDIASVEVWSSLTNDLGSAVLVGSSQGIAFTHAGVATGIQRFYWVRARNTSGLSGPYNAAAGVSVTPGQVAEGDIAANAITADKILAGEINGSHLNINTQLPPTITVGTTGVSIGNPAALVNLNSTVIQPGKIQISGATTLASWRDGTDTTKIAGGNIAANSILANSLTIGLRGIDIAGLEFGYVVAENKVTWTAGVITYMNDAGVMTTQAISAGNAVWTSGTLYVAWQMGQGTLTASSNINAVAGANFVRLATYRGARDLVANYGRTIIDGASIVTGSITADQLSVGELITNNAQIKGGIITNTHLAGNITFDKMAGGTLSAATAVKIGGDRFTLWASSQTLEIHDGQAGNLSRPDITGRLRVKIGKIGANPTDYGAQFFDASGNMIFGTGGWGTNAIPASALQPLDATSASTFISSALITSAMIQNLDASKINATSLSAISINAGDIRAGTIGNTDGTVMFDITNGYLLITETL